MNEIPENDQRVDLKDLSPDALVEFLSGMGKEKFRAVQILRWIYQRNVTDFSAMTDL
ncbi:MAG: 23S rRNA (adenine(2503)-C(2))-methyltransferase RlmN, partial [Deltaproteobacteria bacterium]